MTWFSGSRDENVDELIARKKYGKAVALLARRFKEGSRDSRLRLQLADVLVLSGKPFEAIPILQGLADDYAVEGFAAKAIAVLKKIEKIQPGRADVGQKLAALIERKRQESPSTEALRIAALAPGTAEIGIEEIDEVEAEPAPEGIGSPALDESVPGDDVLGAIHETLQESELSRRAHTASAPIVASPLFSDFTQDELLAVMGGLELQTFSPGDIIITQGEPGDSLFILATGVTSAWVKNAEGHHVKVREMSEGSFFGEISILTGEPRTATVTAASACELLELNRATLDSITASHPRVRDVLNEFYRERAQNA